MIRDVTPRTMHDYELRCDTCDASRTYKAMSPRPYPQGWLDHPAIGHICPTCAHVSRSAQACFGTVRQEQTDLVILEIVAETDNAWVALDRAVDRGLRRDHAQRTLWRLISEGRITLTQDRRLLLG